MRILMDNYIFCSFSWMYIFILQYWLCIFCTLTGWWISRSLQGEDSAIQLTFLSWLFPLRVFFSCACFLFKYLHQITKGLLDKYGPERVIDTPITEVYFLNWIEVLLLFFMYFVMLHSLSSAIAFICCSQFGKYYMFFCYAGWVCWYWSWCGIQRSQTCYRIYDIQLLHAG